jgi:hypothetical protein
MNSENAIKDSINVLKDDFFNHKETKGIQRGRRMNSFYWNALGYINGNMGKPIPLPELRWTKPAAKQKQLPQRRTNCLTINAGSNNISRWKLSNIPFLKITGDKL